MTVTPERVVRRFFELAAEGDAEGILGILDPDLVWQSGIRRLVNQVVVVG